MPLKNNRVSFFDGIFLSFFTILITFHPYFLYGEIKFDELGLYLPAIDAVLHGAIPYRDFFYLRGPGEIYVPAFLMSIWGENITVLSVYFYVGTVLTLLICVFIAMQIYRSRLILYIMVPVLIARTFPRVVFTYWGGFRYGLGLMVIWMAIRFLKKERFLWIWGAGLLSGLCFFTSVEIGVCAITGISIALLISYLMKIHDQRLIQKASTIYFLGMLTFSIPYIFYMIETNSLMDYMRSVYVVLTKMQTVMDIHQVVPMPRNILEALGVMLNPAHDNFKHLTPAYFYLMMIVYLIYRVKKRQFSKDHLSVVCLAGYGVVLYVSAFRNIWASQFEMALQPEKILLFWVFEEICLWKRPEQVLSLNSLYDAMTVWANSFRQNIKPRAVRIPFGNIFLIVLICSSLGYAIQRYNKRFFPFQYACYRLFGKNTGKLIPLSQIKTKQLTLARARGMTVPLEQAQEVETITTFIQEHTAPGEKVFMFPELGVYSFMVDRPFVGRFPVVTLSWFNDDWHQELLRDLIRQRPNYAVLTKNLPENFFSVYFKRPKNKEFYDAVVDYIQLHYHVKKETKTARIYQLKRNTDHP